VAVLFRRETPDRAVVEAQRLISGAQHERLSFTERAVQRFPHDAGVRLEYATALAGAGDDRARREALQYVALDHADDTRRLARAAHLLLELGEVEAARSCVERAVSIGPQGWTAVVVINKLNHMRGLIAIKDGDRERAESFLYLAHNSDPGNEFIARDLAVLLISSPTDGLDRAIAVVDRTLKTAPGTYPGAQTARRMLQGVRAHLDTLDQQ
jgi:tetratricopeptide (TPR) repeat protein